MNGFLAPLWKLRLLLKLLIIRIGFGPWLIEFCYDCGRKQPVCWWSSNELWLQLNDGKHGGAFCPECFDKRAEKSGLLLRWKPELYP